MLFSRPSEFGTAKILAHVTSIEICATFVLIHFFLDGVDALGASEFQAQWRRSGGWYARRSGSGGSGGGRSCRFASSGVGLIGVVPVCIFQASTGHVALLVASEATSLLPILDMFFIGELLERNGGSVDFHWYNIVVVVGARIGVGPLIVLKVPGVMWLLITTEVIQSLVLNFSSTLDFFPSHFLPSVHIDGPILAAQNFTMDDVS